MRDDDRQQGSMFSNRGWVFRLTAAAYNLARVRNREVALS